MYLESCGLPRLLYIGRAHPVHGSVHDLPTELGIRLQAVRIILYTKNGYVDNWDYCLRQ